MFERIDNHARFLLLMSNVDNMLRDRHSNFVIARSLSTSVTLVSRQRQFLGIPEIVVDKTTVRIVEPITDPDVYFKTSRSGHLTQGVE